MLALLGMLSQTIIVNGCNKGAMRNASCTLCTTFATIKWCNILSVIADGSLMALIVSLSIVCDRA